MSSRRSEPHVWVYVRYVDRSSYIKEGHFPLSQAAERVQQFRRDDSVAWAYCDEPEEDAA